MKRFDALIGEENVEALLKNSGGYLAHTPDEALSDHMKLVTFYFQELIRAHNLEPIIDQQILKLCNNSEILADFSKSIFWKAILYHDFGKVNENFQRKLENIETFPESKENGIDSQHSILSAFLFLTHQLTELSTHERNISNNELFFFINWIFALAHNIIRHHSSRLDDFSKKDTFSSLNAHLCVKLTEYLQCYSKDTHPQIINNIPALAKSQVEFENLGFEWFTLIRLNFSMLTAADYYATSHYCSNWKNHYNSFGTLSETQKQFHFSKLLCTKRHNKRLYETYKVISEKPLSDYHDKSNSNLNKLRSRMAAEVILNIRKQSDKHLFYIEAPTGGGKTNMAFIATQELLHANVELNKVFYVFPFTTLATQTKQAAEETLGLTSEEWIELHGRAPWKQKINIENDKDGLYGDERFDDIDNQFVNYPYTFLSHVRFFDILKANNKSSIYLMHRLANSIVVIDEVQAYNPDLWDKMAYLINEYALALNIRFVVMSATLPKIGSLMGAEFTYLLSNAIERFFVNANFADRVSFSDELLIRKQPKKDQRSEYLDWLVSQIYEKSESYKAENGHVRTIVEFIFKKSATEFAELAKERFIEYDVYVLSGTILEPRRREIIKELKKTENKSKNVLLITTQVVEAGVDIDMDLGFKNRSIIDSEEQLAGRVNRNVDKQGCTVYLFDMDDASVIYSKDRRFKETRNSLEKQYFEILRTKNFDLLYEKVKTWLDTTNYEIGLAGTGQHYKDTLVGQLNFPQIDKEFTLIDQFNTSVFVPIELPILNESDLVFTKEQLNFLKQFGVEPTSGQLSGEKVFELYKQLINDRTFSFMKKKRNLKVLQSILAMFTFSLFSESEVIKKLMEGGNSEEFGYLYLLTHEEVYDYEMGLQDNKFNELIFL